MYAKGQLRENALISPTIGFIAFPVVYFLFKIGCSPIALSWAMLLLYVLLGLVIKPLLLVRIVEYKWTDIWQVFQPCLLVTMVSLPVPLLLDWFFVELDNIWQDVLLLLISIVSVGISVWYLGVNLHTREMIVKRLKTSIKIDN